MPATIVDAMALPATGYSVVRAVLLVVFMLVAVVALAAATVAFGNAGGLPMCFLREPEGAY